MSEYPVRLDDLIAYVTNLHPDADELRHLSDAMLLSTHLSEVSDHLIGHFVDRARRAGASWTEIGQSMGVSKQAAQKRFVPKDSGGQSYEVLFGRYTPRARRAVEQALEEARCSLHPKAGVEHLVLGLLHDPGGLAARAFAEFGVSPEDVRQAVTTPGEEPEPVTGIVPFSREAGRVLQLTLREALGFGHNYVGTEHLLLGILAADDEPAAQALTGLGVTKARAEEWVAAEIEKLTKPARGGS
jgi:hypothetical protein